MLSPTPHQHAGLASKLAEVTGKAPCDLNAWDLKKISAESWAPGHWVCWKNPNFAGKHRVLQQQHHTAATTQSSHSPSVGGHPKNGSGKSLCPTRLIHSSLSTGGSSSFSPNPCFQAETPQELSSARLLLEWEQPKWSRGALLKHPLPKSSCWKSPEQPGFVEWGIPHSLPGGRD